MAAIISQMAANKRARQKGGGQARLIPADKCVYTLPPFDPCFDPKVHNKYIRAMSNNDTTTKRNPDNRRQSEYYGQPMDTRLTVITGQDIAVSLGVLCTGIVSVVFLIIYIYCMFSSKSFMFAYSFLCGRKRFPNGVLESKSLLRP